jgi:hypothetical protein
MPWSLNVKALFVVTLKSNLHHILLTLPYRGYEMSRGRSLSRDSLTAKTTTAKARLIKNSTRNHLLKKPVPSGVAMSKLSNGTKKHTSKSRETPLKSTSNFSMKNLGFINIL